jgi:hypothetical protein
MRGDIARVLAAHFEEVSLQERLPQRIHDCVRKLRLCRTGALGGHVERCPEGHVERVVQHSCRHRLCPQCNALPNAQWLQSMQARLLACAHHHVVFTLPHELHEVWRYNRRWFQQALFAAVAETLRSLREVAPGIWTAR